MTRSAARPGMGWKLALVAVGLAGAVAVGPSAPIGAQPRCFGAAARDPKHQPCANPALRLSVVPTPSDALITPGEPCTPLAGGGPPEVCAFGAAAARAAATVALVGDSHSAHWRAALRVVARAKAWRVLSIYRSQCPFSMAGTRLPGRARTECARWRRDTIDWFRRHREVHTVFVSQRARARVVGHPGSDQAPADVEGYIEAWRALPASVEHIIVIRDVPYSAPTTRRCIEGAMANRRPAGRACARARDAALAPDPAMDAAARLHSRRVQSVDLTPFMCDAQRCYPVIGGVLVIKDIGHLTRLFSTTLGPFLLREVNRLIAGW